MKQEHIENKKWAFYLITVYIQDINKINEKKLSILSDISFFNALLYSDEVCVTQSSKHGQ